MKPFTSLPITKDKHGFLRVIFYIAIILTNFSYFPFIINSVGNVLTIVMWSLLLITFFVYCFIENKQIPKKFLYIAVLVVTFLLCSAIQYIFVSSTAFETRIFRTVLTFFVVISVGVLSSSLFNNKKHFRSIMTVFSYSCLFMALCIFFIYLLKSNISGTEYGYQDGKNEISVLFFSSSIFFLFKEHKSKFFIVFDYLVFLFFILVIVFLRCRAVLVSYIIPLLFAIFSKNKQLNYYRIPLLATLSIGLIGVLAIPKLRDLAFKALISFGRDDVTLETFATGRFEELFVGMHLLSKNPLFGIGRQKVEMFFGSIIVQYGFIFSLPILLIANIPLLPLVNHNFKTLEQHIKFLVILGLSYIFLGFFEELMPIGPGVRTYILWLSIGIWYFKEEKIESQSLVRLTDNDSYQLLQI